MKRETFDSYLSSALGIKRKEGNDKIKHLNEIDESHYVLTLDYTVKVHAYLVQLACSVLVIYFHIANKQTNKNEHAVKLKYINK